MNDDAFEAFAMGVREGIIAAQMVAYAGQSVARELLPNVARLQPDPEQYLTSLYDRVIARWDPDGHAVEKEVHGEVRDLIGAMFRDAVKSVQESPDRSP